MENVFQQVVGLFDDAQGKLREEGIRVEEQLNGLQEQLNGIGAQIKKLDVAKRAILGLDDVILDPQKADLGARLDAAGGRVTVDMGAVAQGCLPTQATINEEGGQETNGHRRLTIEQRVRGLFHEHRRMKPYEVRHYLSRILQKPAGDLQGTVSKTLSDLKASGYIRRIGVATYELVE